LLAALPNSTQLFGLKPTKYDASYNDTKSALGASLNDDSITETVLVT